MRFALAQHAHQRVTLHYSFHTRRLAHAQCVWFYILQAVRFAVLFKSIVRIRPHHTPSTTPCISVIPELSYPTLGDRR